jgi:hypothetical protein
MSECVCPNEQDVSLFIVLQVTLVGPTSSLGNSISLLSFSCGPTSLFGGSNSLYSFPMGRLLFRGVLPLFNGLPLTYGIFFSSKKGCLGGKYLPQLPKPQQSLYTSKTSLA